MEQNESFELDVYASADLGRDVFEGPCQDRHDVSVSSILRAGESVTVLVDIAAAGPVEMPLLVARQLADALSALLADLDSCHKKPQHLR